MITKMKKIKIFKNKKLFLQKKKRVQKKQQKNKVKKKGKQNQDSTEIKIDEIIEDNKEKKELLERTDKDHLFKRINSKVQFSEGVSNKEMDIPFIITAAKIQIQTSGHLKHWKKLNFHLKRRKR